MANSHTSSPRMQQRKLLRKRNINRVFHTFTLAARPGQAAWFSFMFLSIAPERERPERLWLRVRGSQRGSASGAQEMAGPLSIPTVYRQRSITNSPLPALRPGAQHGATTSGPPELFEFKPPRLKYPFKPPPPAIGRPPEARAR